MNNHFNKWLLLSFWLFIGIFSIILPCSATTEVCDCEPEIRCQIPAFDDAAYLTQAQKDCSINTHLPWGIPATWNASNESLIVLSHFILNYDSDLNTSTWAAYHLSRVRNVKRMDCFRNYPAEIHPDETPPSCFDYEQDSFDRGHLVNSNDIRMTRTANANTFFLANMAPQYPDFNRGIWRYLESRVHDLVGTGHEIYIITGAIYDHDSNQERDMDEEMKPDHDSGNIAVASAFYKIIARQTPGNPLETLCIVMPHDNRSITGSARRPYVASNIKTIKYVKDLTGIEFFPNLEKSMILESSELWWDD